jgi:hypothetical protein
MASSLRASMVGGIAAILIAVSAHGGADMSERTGPTHYAGQVLDFDGGAPMSGVIVTVMWYREGASMTGQAATDQFHAAFEMRTGADGRYEVPARPRRPLPHGDQLQTPVALFFLPGYIDWHHRFVGDPRSPDPRTIVQLKRAVDPVVAVKDVTIPQLVPHAESPLLVGALNQERARLGLPALAPSE